jgi:hypothetical protein
MPGKSGRLGPRLEAALLRQAGARRLAASGIVLTRRITAGIDARPQRLAGGGTGFVVAILDQASVAVGLPQGIASGFLQTHLERFTRIEPAIAIGLPTCGNAFRRRIVWILLCPSRSGGSRKGESEHSDAESMAGVTLHHHLDLLFLAPESPAPDRALPATGCSRSG